MANHSDCVLIGGGVIGLTAAYELAKAGLKVTVLDKSDLGQEASWAGAGILPPGNPERARTPFDRFRAQSSNLYPALSAELMERTGQDNGYLRSGGIEFVPESGHAADEWRTEGIEFESLHAADVRRLEPAVESPPGSAYYLPGIAQVRNPRHLKALIAGCESLGVTFHTHCPALGFDRKASRILGVLTHQFGVVMGRHFITAAGAWSEPLLNEVGFRPAIHPVRGQMALLNSGKVILKRLLLLGPRYLVPRDDGRTLVGSTEEEVGFDKRTTSAAIRGLLDLALALVPALGEAELERSWAGLRPGNPAGIPYIGSVPGFENLFVATGHYRGGIQLAPATAILLKELILGQKPTLPTEPFRLDRA